MRSLKRAFFLWFLWIPLVLSACTPDRPPTPVTPIPALPTVSPPSHTAATLPTILPPTSAIVFPPGSPTARLPTPLDRTPSATPAATLTRIPLATLPATATPMPSATLALTPTVASSDQSLELLSRLGGPYGAAVSVAGDDVYVAVGERFVVLDISNSARPKQVGQSALLPSFIVSLTVRNDFAFVTTYKAGVAVFSISKVRQPRLIATLPEVEAQQLAFSGDRAYALDDTGFHIYRLADASHWTRVGSLQLAGGSRHLAVVGNHAYVTGTGLHIIEVSDPAQPREIGAYTAMQGGSDLAVIGNYAWVLTGDLLRGRTFTGEMHVVDIHDPARPARVEVMPFDQPTRRIVVANGFAYVGAFWDLHVLNAADPASPKHVSTYRTSTLVSDLVNVGQLLMVASADGDALRIIDVAHPEQPRGLGTFFAPKKANRIVVAGRYAYVADTHYGFLVMDVADPREPVIVGQAPELFDGRDIALADGYVYVSEPYGLRVFQFVNPTRPVAVGSVPLDMGSYESRLSLVGHRAFVTAGKVFVVDISHPDAPTLLSTLRFPEAGADDLATTGHYALISASDTLHVVDIADSTRLVEVGSLRLADRPSTVRVAGDYAYVVIYQSGLHILSLADVTRPAEVAFVPVGNVSEITLAGSLAWLADNQVGIYALDIIHPNHPVPVNALSAKLASNSATVMGDYLYAVETTGGIAIFRVHR